MVLVSFHLLIHGTSFFHVCEPVVWWDAPAHQLWPETDSEETPGMWRATRSLRLSLWAEAMLRSSPFWDRHVFICF